MLPLGLRTIIFYSWWKNGRESNKENLNDGRHLEYENLNFFENGVWRFAFGVFGVIFGSFFAFCVWRKKKFERNCVLRLAFIGFCRGAHPCSNWGNHLRRNFLMLANKITKSIYWSNLGSRQNEWIDGWMDRPKKFGFGQKNPHLIQKRKKRDSNILKRFVRSRGNRGKLIGKIPII